MGGRRIVGWLGWCFVLGKFLYNFLPGNKGYFAFMLHKSFWITYWNAYRPVIAAFTLFVPPIYMLCLIIGVIGGLYTFLKQR